MAEYTLDELAARIMAHEKKRKETGFPFAMDGTGLEGNWQNASVTEKPIGT